MSAAYTNGVAHDPHGDDLAGWIPCDVDAPAESEVVRAAASETPPSPSTAPWEGRVASAETAWFTKPPPSRRWLLSDARGGRAGVLPLGKVGLVIAEGGGKKTMTLVGAAIAVATGSTWLGCFEVEEQGRVLLVLGEEDLEEVQRRCFNSARASRTNAPPADSIVVLALAGVACPMIESDDRGNAIDAPFLRWTLSFVEERGPFKLIVIDPLSRFAGSDAEIDNAAATRFVQACESIATATGATVLVAHHTNKTSRANGASVNGASARGSSAIYDGVRWAAALSTERIKELAEAGSDLAEIVTLSVVKSNYSRKGDPVTLRPDNDNGGALVPLTARERETVAMAREGAEPTTRRRAQRDADREAREAREADQRERRAQEREADRAAREAKQAAKRAERDRVAAASEVERIEAEDAAVRVCVAAEPGLNEGRLLAAMRARIGKCSDQAGRAAIERARLAGWLEVRTGAKNAKEHHPKDGAA